MELTIRTTKIQYTERSDGQVLVRQIFPDVSDDFTIKLV